MGWYGDSNVTCPYCEEETAVQQYRNNMMESYYLMCPACGFCMYCEERMWVVDNSYIDKSIIGKKPEDLNPSDDVNTEKNENVVPKGMTW